MFKRRQLQAFRHDTNKRAKWTQPNPSPRSSTQQSVKNASRTRSPRGRSPSGKNISTPVQGLPQRNLHAPIHSVKSGTLQNACSTSPKSGCRFGDKCSYAHRQVDEQPGTKSKKNGDESAVAILKNTRQLGCVVQDMEPPKSSSILRKSSNILKPIRCVRFTEAVVRHANIRDQNPSLAQVILISASPNAPKFEDRSQEETEWQERCAREAAWKLAKNILKIKGET